MTHTTTSTALDTVLDYHRAWTSGDIDQAMSKVADDVVCHAPGGDLTGKDAYRGFIAGFAPNLTGLRDVASFADGDHVALFYYPYTAVTSTAPAAECFTVRDGLIAESVLVFDRLSFTPPPSVTGRAPR
jgi:ketosteroid isomerase-like protein